MEIKKIMAALIVFGASGAAIAQSASAPVYVVTEQKYVVIAPEPKTREQVNAELREARESNQLLLGENAPANDVLSRPYGLLMPPGGQTSVGAPEPAGSQGMGR